MRAMERVMGTKRRNRCAGAPTAGKDAREPLRASALACSGASTPGGPGIGAPWRHSADSRFAVSCALGHRFYRSPPRSLFRCSATTAWAQTACAQLVGADGRVVYSDPPPRTGHRHARQAITGFRPGVRRFRRTPPGWPAVSHSANCAIIQIKSLGSCLSGNPSNGHMNI